VKSWSEIVDSPAEEFDIDEALNEWLDKTAAESEGGVDPYADEAAIIKRFQETQSPEDFEWLYNRHQGMIANAIRNAVGNPALPKSVVKSWGLKQYSEALQRFDPSKGAQLSTYLSLPMKRLGRWRNRYQNIGYIPEDRARHINLIQERERELTDLLGRPPSDTELADDVNIARKDLEHMRRIPEMSIANVGKIRREIRPDLVAESVGGAATLSGPSELKERMVMLHGSLSPEDQMVLEHTYGDVFSRDTVEDPAELALKLNLSPQKIRASRSRILRKAERYY
jgi:DNA-directed RNA polymerase specialized sigma subunit